MRVLCCLLVLVGCGTTVVVEESNSGGGSNQASGGAGGSGASGGGIVEVVPCEQRADDDCQGDALCVALYDWSGVQPGAPPPPPDVDVKPESCCPSCKEAACIGCHTKEFTRCIPIAQCGVPQPHDQCGVPDSCP